MVTLALSLGAALDLSSHELAILRLCALFHDVGKIGIPDSMLLKPTEFSDEEWEMMKTHSERGENIVRATGLAGADKVATVIRHHHENYAGNGYPDGLSGDEIPLLSRIIFIVDAYDAMRMTRPYRPPMIHERVMSILESESSWKFDPIVYKTFTKVVKDQPDVLK